jgi:uncharacterized protein with ATP-grasp and redox domains
MAMTTRAALHQLVDELDEEYLTRASEALSVISETASLRRLARAPLDDEPYTEEERRADDAALREVLDGKAVPTEEVKRLLARGA